MDQQTPNTPQNKPPSSDGINFCNKYFRDNPPSSWTYRSFLSHYATLVPPIRLDIVNSRYIKALEKIEDSLEESADRKKKARSLIDKHRNTHQQRSNAQSSTTEVVPSFVVHGDIIHSGHDVSIHNGNRTTVRKRESSSTASRAKRRALAPSSYPDRPQSPDNVAGSIDDPVCLGDMVEAYNDVQIVNGDRVTSTIHDTGGDVTDAQPVSPDLAHPLQSIDPPQRLNRTSENFCDFDPDYGEFYSRFPSLKNRRIFATSGRVLEEIIYDGVQENDETVSSLEGNPILRCILDLDDDRVSSWFEAAELAELRESLPPLPEVDESFKYAVRRFSGAKTVQELWSVVESSPRPPLELYDRSRNFDATYVNTAAGSILSMMESLKSCEWLGPQALREGWFGSNVWGPIVDRSLLGVDNLVVSRTEIKSKSELKDNKRFDAIMLALAGIEVSEFGAIEVARTADAIAPKKRAIDSTKLQNILRSMLCQLKRQVDDDWEVVKQLQVVGIQHVGFTIQISRMTAVSSNVFLLQRGRLRTVPTTLEKFHSVFEIMQSMVVTKKILERSMAVITRYKSDVTEGKEQFEDFEL
ncbi:uncharacterized protein H6S33_011715 [Morchella sextelata]|uniref:uncharacterized protein n=1 Tax=Morchella sextelata TaxID=1174677 RepID=UPI001D037325|nr:uncharacterized protein H6S33_011715 [Morchella sextelata]KAH0610188.1 hypothetical protein H6S33_011715 [Morchella sextelata]